jgi:hypothetical protein
MMEAFFVNMPDDTTEDQQLVFTINGRDFTYDQFVALTRRSRGELVSEHARRISAALGVGMVAVFKSPQGRPLEDYAAEQDPPEALGLRPC